MLSECIYKVLMASGVVTSSDACDLSGAIEAAVLEELAKQKPAYTFHLDSTGAAYLRGECVSKEGDPLYTAPVVQEKQEPWPFSADRVTYHKAAPVVQEKQEPVAWMHWYKYYDGTDVVKVAIGHATTFNDQSPFRSEPLYAAPVVPPDMVMVPREATEAMLDAAMNRYKHVSPEAKARYTQMHRENFRCDYKAMIAAAEGKSNAELRGRPLADGPA